MNYLITIVGPTGIGKTSLSIALAKYYDCEIISADSRQFFIEMNIGTAVPNAQELATVPHHFIHNKSIQSKYSVGQFEKEVIEKMNVLFKSKNIQILVGGSGLYIDAVLYGLDDFPDIPSDIRQKLNLEYKNLGLKHIQDKLYELDKETFETIEIQNPHRVLRALEVCIGTGQKYSSFKKVKNIKRDFIPILIGLESERKTIYSRIEERVDQMIEAGLVKEVENLIKYKDLNALKTVGYSEIFDYLNENTTLEKAVEEIKKNTRRFAKRQLTWFKKNKKIQWFDFQTPFDKIIRYINQKLN